MAKMYRARAEREAWLRLVEQGRKDARKRLETRKLDEAKEAMDDEKAIREHLGMPIPKEIVDNAKLLVDEGEMSDAEFEALVNDGPPIVDKDAETKRLS